MPDQSDIAFVLNAHNTDDLTVGFIAPELNAIANFFPQLIHPHERLMPSIFGYDTLISLS
jgi:hypothetical protein